MDLRYSVVSLLVLSAAILMFAITASSGCSSSNGKTENEAGINTPAALTLSKAKR